MKRRWSVGEVVRGYLSAAKSVQRRSFLLPGDSPSRSIDDDVDSIRFCNSSTSTHDLSTFVWGTGGIGIVDEDSTCWSGCEASTRKADGSSREGAPRRMVDSGTSTFDLPTFVWDTAGSMTSDDDEEEVSLPSPEDFAGNSVDTSALIVTHRFSNNNKFVRSNQTISLDLVSSRVAIAHEKLDSPAGGGNSSRGRKRAQDSSNNNGSGPSKWKKARAKSFNQGRN